MISKSSFGSNIERRRKGLARDLGLNLLSVFFFNYIFHIFGEPLGFLSIKNSLLKVLIFNDFKME